MKYLYFVAALLSFHLPNAFAGMNDKDILLKAFLEGGLSQLSLKKPVDSKSSESFEYFANLESGRFRLQVDSNWEQFSDLHEGPGWSVQVWIYEGDSEVPIVAANLEMTDSAGYLSYMSVNEDTRDAGFGSLMFRIVQQIVQLAGLPGMTWFADAPTEDPAVQERLERFYERLGGQHAPEFPYAMFLDFAGSHL